MSENPEDEEIGMTMAPTGQPIPSQTKRLPVATAGRRGPATGTGARAGAAATSTESAKKIPTPTASPNVPVNTQGRPDYNYYAEMMNPADEQNAYNRDFINLRETARQAAVEAGMRGEKFRFVPIKDVKNNRVYFVNASGDDVSIDMNDQQGREQDRKSTRLNSSH